MEAGLITFRETLEGALVVGIIITYLYKTKQQTLYSFVVKGIIVGIVASFVLGIFLQGFLNGLPPSLEPLFEGSLMFITALFLTWMILWVHRQKDISRTLTQKVARHAQKGYGLGIFFLVATSLFREGTEAVLYITASVLTGSSNQLLGACIGIVGAVLLSVGLFKFAMRINLSALFNITSIFLLLFAAGLVAHGVHEFQELHILPVFSFDPILDVSHILDQESVVGSFLRVLFGYTSTPTFLEFVSYGSYIISIVWLERFTNRLLSRD